MSGFRAGEVSFSDAVEAGLFCLLGTGSVDIAAMVVALQKVGYDGWYVLEQDVRLVDAEPAGEGPLADVRAALHYLVAVAQ